MSVRLPGGGIVGPGLTRGPHRTLRPCVLAFPLTSCWSLTLAVLSVAPAC